VEEKEGDYLIIIIFFSKIKKTKLQDKNTKEKKSNFKKG